VHLGLEFTDSAIRRLAVLPIKTALRQLAYTISDPLIGALAIDLPQNEQIIANKMFKGDSGAPISIRHTQGSALFQRSPQITAEINKFKLFLKQLGCVNFFEVYNPTTTVQPSNTSVSVSGPSIPIPPNVPTLFAVLNKLLQHGKPVNTDQNHVKEEQKDLREERSSIYVPVFLPFKELQVLEVTLDVHTSLCVVFELVEEELEVYI
jgi:hypothetical protein